MIRTLDVLCKNNWSCKWQQKNLSDPQFKVLYLSTEKLIGFTSVYWAEGGGGEGVFSSLPPLKLICPSQKFVSIRIFLNLNE